ncbi:MAG TPA: Holliday junction branch migration protein RuvA [Gammaproteobacteria bacterium]|nr:Holliday junction branch migration protein RuvA [Gammaproteobacteria bacterium]
MIGRIRGKLCEKRPPHVLIDVHGVGYSILAPLSTFLQLPDLEQEVILYTEFIVREDAQTLYGFIKEEDKALFQQIIKVNGVGPKVALGILSGMEPHFFVECIQQENLNALTKLPGIGKKTAERLVIELRDKLKSMQREIPMLEKNSTTTQSKQEAIAALEALGFKSREAEHAISKVYHETKTAEELIRLALQGS